MSAFEVKYSLEAPAEKTLGSFSCERIFLAKGVLSLVASIPAKPAAKMNMIVQPKGRRRLLSGNEWAPAAKVL